MVTLQSRKGVAEGECDKRLIKPTVCREGRWGNLLITKSIYEGRRIQAPNEC